MPAFNVQNPPIPQEITMEIVSSAPRDGTPVPQTVMVPYGYSSLQRMPSVVTPRDDHPTFQVPVEYALPSPPLQSIAPLQEEPLANVTVSSDGGNSDSEQKASAIKPRSSGTRLNKFVRRLHDMLRNEQKSSIVEWRRGLLVLHSTDAFAKTILPKYFNTRNFKTFRRQLNYYGFVHVRSFSTTGSTTTALWVNRELAQTGTAKISSVLQLKRVEPCESAKTAEGRRVRKELAVSTVENDIGVNAKTLQIEQIRSMAFLTAADDAVQLSRQAPLLPRAADPENESAAQLLLMLSKSAAVF